MNETINATITVTKECLMANNKYLSWSCNPLKWLWLKLISIPLHIGILILGIMLLVFLLWLIMKMMR